MIGVRFNTLSEGGGAVGEPEQDANSALTELDKGLRSGKVGEQCEAIVRFPRLFEKYPFPILINSSFLKLADVFRVGNNFLRLWVLRVCQQSEKHLDKILNVDEFVRRIFSVLHSNDPVARALALRTLGAVAGIIPERQNVQHAVRRGLDSHDNVEVDAAVHATMQFAKHSNAFAVSMCNKLSDMVECEATGAERRARLVRALRTVHGGAVRAHGVLRLLRSLLERFPSVTSVRAAIVAITAIASDTVVHVPDQIRGGTLYHSSAFNSTRGALNRRRFQSLTRWQLFVSHSFLHPLDIQSAENCVRDILKLLGEIPSDISSVELLLSIAVKDARTVIQRSALLGLKTLAEHAALWPGECIRSLVVLAARNSEHKLLCLQLMQMVVRCRAVCAAGAGGAHELGSLREFCSEAVLSVDLRVAATAADVLTSIVLYCYQESIPVEGARELVLALESLVIATGLRRNGQNNIAPLRMALRCLVQLCNAEPLQYAPRTARVLGSQLKNSSWKGYPDSSAPKEQECDMTRTVALLEALCALGGSAQCPQTIAPSMPSVVAKLKEIGQVAAQIVEKEGAKMEKEESAEEGGVEDEWGTATVLLCTVVCQERAGNELPAPLWEQYVLAALQTANSWTQYRVARAALRYGHHKLAATLLGKLAKVAPSESAQRWLTSLHRAAAADLMLTQQGVCEVEAACAGWERAAGGAEGRGACAAGCAGCGSCSSMSSAWMSARAAWLACLARATRAAKALCTQPPPAIAHAQAQAARDPAARAGACVGAVRRARAAAQACAQRYAAIARTAFHADNATLRHLHILQHTCNLMAQLMERITTANYQERQAIELTFSGKELRPESLEERLLLAVCTEVQDITNKLFNSPDTKPGITHRHMEALVSATRACCGGALWPRGVCAGSGEGARCRVSLSPAARTPVAGQPAEHAATLNITHHLALKIEGVILHPLQPKKMKQQEQRQVKGVQLIVTATPHPRTNDKSVELSSVPAVLSAVQTVPPVRDFFSAQQLIAVTGPGLYTVAVEAAMVDQFGETWNTGPRTSIVIKAHEDPIMKSNSQASRGRF